MFRRRKRDGADEQAGPVDDESDDVSQVDDDDEDEVDEDEVAEGSAERDDRRPQGPWDADDVPDDETVRLDLGSLRVPGAEGLEIQVNLEEASGNVVAVTVVLGDSALQLQAFAAPRGEAIWPEVREELAAEITRDGGQADAEDDELGPTLRAQLPFPQPDGSTVLGDVRFVGTDGPRWLLRGVLSGRAAVEPAAAEPLLAVYRGTVVVRGNDPYAPREPLALRLPEGAPPPPGQSGPSGPGREPPDFGGTGQRIAEVR